MMVELKTVPGQSLKEKEYLENIKKKNAEMERLPRGIFIKKSH